MMTKKTIQFIFSLFFIFGIIIPSVAQEDKLVANDTYIELGINATSFVKEFLSLNSNDVDAGPYMLTYKRHSKGEAFRLGVGGRLSQLKEDMEGGGTRTNKDNFFSIRLGYEWNKKISKRWATYAGVDVTADYSNSVSVTNNFEETKITNTVSAFGGGPILGVQFFINSHISLATEGTLYYQHSIINEKQEFSVNTIFNSDQTSTEDKMDFGLPTALYFIIRF